MNLMDVLRSGKRGAVEANFKEEESGVDFGDEFGPLFAMAHLRLRIETAPDNCLLLYILTEINGNNGSFVPRHELALAVGEDSMILPSDVLPDEFWSELDQRLHQAIMEKWMNKDKESSPILSDK